MEKKEKRKFKLFDTPFKKAIAIITALSLLGTGIWYALSKKSKKAVPQYYTVSMDTVKKGDKQASLFNVGNYKVKGKSGLKNLVKANEKGVPAGAIINTIASNKGEILLDGEYAKYLVENTNVDYPIYLDVTGLLENNDLRIDEILELISSFCSKLTANSIFVGIYGSEEDIKKLSDYDESKILKAYDILYKNDDPEINLEYSSMIKTDEKGKHYTETDIKQTIDKNDLNTKDKIKHDLAYTLTTDDDFAEIAYSYNLSPRDLLIYNEMEEKDIKEGKEIRIPTRYSGAKAVKQSSSDGAIPVIGIDASSHQKEEDTDWDEIQEKVPYVILRGTYGSSKDKLFETKVVEASKRNIKIGSYLFNVCLDDIPKDSPEFENFKNQVDDEIKAFLDAVSGKNIKLPLFIDLEDETFENYTKYFKLNKDQIVYLLDKWYEEVTKAGYTPGIYTTASIYRDKLSSYKEGLDRFDLWLSGNNAYFNSKENGFKSYFKNMTYDEVVAILAKGEFTKDDLNRVDENYNITGVDMIQVSAAGLDFGTGNYNGYVDIDICFSDYIDQANEENAITDEEAKLLYTMKPEQKSKLVHEISEKFKSEEFQDGAILGFLAGASLEALAIYKVICYIRKKEAESSISGNAKRKRK